MRYWPEHASSDGQLTTNEARRKLGQPGYFFTGLAFHGGRDLRQREARREHELNPDPRATDWLADPRREGHVHLEDLRECIVEPLRQVLGKDAVDLTHVSQGVFPCGRLSTHRAGEGNETASAIAAPDLTRIRIFR
jgi:hypothetical protein